MAFTRTEFGSDGDTHVAIFNHLKSTLENGWFDSVESDESRSPNDSNRTYTAKCYVGDTLFLEFLYYRDHSNGNTYQWYLFLQNKELRSDGLSLTYTRVSETLIDDNMIIIFSSARGTGGYGAGYPMIITKSEDGEILFGGYRTDIHTKGLRFYKPTTVYNDLNGDLYGLVNFSNIKNKKFSYVVPFITTDTNEIFEIPRIKLPLCVDVMWESPSTIVYPYKKYKWLEIDGERYLMPEDFAILIKE